RRAVSGVQSAVEDHERPRETSADVIERVAILGEYHRRFARAAQQTLERSDLAFGSARAACRRHERRQQLAFAMRIRETELRRPHGCRIRRDQLSRWIVERQTDLPFAIARHVEYREAAFERERQGSRARERAFV